MFLFGFFLSLFSFFFEREMLSSRLFRASTMNAALRASTRTFSTNKTCLLAKKEDTQEPVDPNAKQGAGFIKSVLYGKELNGAGNVLAPLDDNTTHSKKLARGKYVHEMQSKF